MEGEVRRFGCIGGATPEGTRGGERQAEEAAGGSDTRQRHAEGPHDKKMVTPVARREAVAHLCQTYAVSERRACRVIGSDRSSVRYRSCRPDDAAIRQRLRSLAAE